MKKSIILAMVGLTLAAVSAQADDAKAPKWYDKLGVTGYIDAYYQANFNGQSGGESGNINPSINPGSTFATRSLDLRQNEFTFDAAKVALTLQDDATKVGGEVDLLYGPLGVYSIGNSFTGSPVEQAFVTFPLGPVSFKVGKMVTHMSNEVIDITGNWNYSRSILFNQVPFYHVGVMANYAPVDGLGLMAGVMNGNSIEQANDEAKDYAAQITYTKIANLSLTANYYLESNRTLTGEQPFENTHYFEFIATYQTLPSLAFALDYLYKTTIASADKDAAGNFAGDVSSPKAQGYALYANYITPVKGLSVIPRFEQYYAPDDGALDTSGATLAFDYTLTVKYVTGPLTHSLELRRDIAYPGAFEPSGSLATTSDQLTSTQTTLTYAATYTF